MNIKKAIARGVDYLSKSQDTNGSFPLFYSSDPEDFSHTVLRQSVFPAVCIFNSLSHVSGVTYPVLPCIQKNIAAFLLSQKSPQWSWNYWLRNSDDAKTSPYPDDLDDTVLALAALYQWNPRLVNGKAIAGFVQLLTALEIAEGGPYRTWIAPDTIAAVWKDVDVAVNANIGFLLSLLDIDLPNVNRLLSQAIRSNKCVSPYYYLPYPVWYFISRWHKGRGSNTVRKELVRHCRKGGWENAALPTALAVVTIMNQFDMQTVNRLTVSMVDKGIEFLLSCQEKDGGWPAYALLLGKTKNEGAWFAGSNALTTGFCLEALSYYSSYQLSPLRSEASRGTAAISHQQTNLNTIQAVLDQVKKRFTLLEEPLQGVSLSELEKTLANDRDHQIALLPFLFRSMLKKQYQRQISDEFCVTLAMANLFGWMAYTIYDDFLDAEGNPLLLSVANVCLRELTLLFASALPVNDHYQRYYRSILNTIDRANIWEVMNARISSQLSAFSPQLSVPDYGNLSQLAEKSLGHALGPITILFALKFETKALQDKEIRILKNFFIHYLIARQLNDDAHDWEEDLKRGQINAVGARVLVESRKSKVRQRKTRERLKEIFWYTVAPVVAKEVLLHVKNAKTALASMTILETRKPFLHILEKYKNAATQMIEERRTTLEFLEGYS